MFEDRRSDCLRYTGWLSTSPTDSPRPSGPAGMMEDGAPAVQSRAEQGSGRGPSVTPRVRFQSVLRVCWAIGCGVVIVGSLLPANSAPLRFLAALNINDKLEHLGAYAALALLPALHERPRLLSSLLLLLLLLGVLLEFGQLYSPGRSFEAGDMLADASGLMLGWLCALPLRRLTAIPKAG